MATRKRSTTAEGTKYKGAQNGAPDQRRVPGKGHPAKRDNADAGAGKGPRTLTLPALSLKGGSPKRGRSILPSRVYART